MIERVTSHGSNSSSQLSQVIVKPRSLAVCSLLFSLSSLYCMMAFMDSLRRRQRRSVSTTPAFYAKHQCWLTPQARYYFSELLTLSIDLTPSRSPSLPSIPYEPLQLHHFTFLEKVILSCSQMFSFAMPTMTCPNCGETTTYPTGKAEEKTQCDNCGATIHC